jgi:hypothetical protein
MTIKLWRKVYLRSDQPTSAIGAPNREIVG